MTVAGSQPFTSCINAGYNLTSLTGSDLFFTGTGNAAGTGTVYNWAIRPCGVVTTPSFCTSQPGEFCQGSTTVSAMNVSAAGVGSGAIWGQIALNGQYGVAQFLQDGTSCGGTGGTDREGTIVYLCNPTALTPYISSLLEITTCNYQAIIQTAAICSQVPSTGFSTAVGTSIISSQCGGGIYDLNPINRADIVGYSSGSYWGIRPCGTLALRNCSGYSNISVCQFSPGNGFVAATYTPALIPTVYQYLAPGVVSQILQDGAACGSQSRLTNITFYCNALATTPLFISAYEYITCHYQLSVQTSAVCGAAFVAAPIPTVCTTAPACTSAVPVPPAWYNLTFSINPATVTGAATSTFGWEATDGGDDMCALQHEGIVTLNASSSQYIDLNEATGSNSGGSALPGSIGGSGSGSLSAGTMGWSFEATFRPSPNSANAKVFALGAGAPQFNVFLGNDGTSNGGLNFGLYDGNTISSLDYSDGHSGIIELTNPYTQYQWYHVVAVLQQVSTASLMENNVTHGAWWMYLNGQLLGFTSGGVSPGQHAPAIAASSVGVPGQVGLERRPRMERTDRHLPHFRLRVDRFAGADAVPGRDGRLPGPGIHRYSHRIGLP